MVELTKIEKRHAIASLDKSLELEFGNGIPKFDRILSQWKDKKKVNRVAYYKLFKVVKSFDIHIAQRYDDIVNTCLFYTVCEFFSHKIIQEEDLSPFREEIQNIIIKWAEGFE